MMQHEVSPAPLFLVIEAPTPAAAPVFPAVLPVAVFALAVVALAVLTLHVAVAIVLPCHNMLVTMIFFSASLPIPL